MANIRDQGNKQTRLSLAARIDLDSVSKRYLDSLKEGLCSAFDSIDDALFDLANNARNNNEQNRYFEAMRELRLRRKSITEKFLGSLTIDITKGYAKPGTELPAIASPSELTLVDTNSLEESLAIETMVRKANARCQHVTLTLEPRLKHIYGDQGREDSLPFLPSSVANAVNGSCADLEIELTELLLLYKHLDKHLFSRLSDVYEQLNNTLINNGVLPELDEKQLRRSIKNTGATSSSAHPAGESRDAVPKSAYPNMTSGTQRSQNFAGKSSQAVTQTANKQELLAALDILSHSQSAAFTNSANQSNIISASDLKTQMLELLSQSNEKAISEQDLDIINLVSMLFEFILDDPNLAPEMQALIGRLQLPTLQVILRDPEFFNEHQHPARTFLDQFAKAAIGWTSSDSATGTNVYEELKAIVMRIVGASQQNRAVFQQADRELSFFIEREEKRRSLLEQRTKLTEEGRIKSRIAQEFVDSALNEISSEIHLPESISELLEGPWRRVMFLAFLKDAQGHNWANSRKIAEDLVWCTQHHLSDSDRQKWVTLVPKLLKQVASELGKISYDKHVADKIIEQIRKSLAELFRDSALSNQAAKTPAFRKPQTSSTNAIQTQIRAKEARDQRAPSELLDFRVGRWVELTVASKGKQRYKLISHIIEADTYVFADRLGLHPIELNRQQLLAKLASKEVTLLAKGGLVDRALSNVMTNRQRYK